MNPNNFLPTTHIEWKFHPNSALLSSIQVLYIGIKEIEVSIIYLQQTIIQFETNKHFIIYGIQIGIEEIIMFFNGISWGNKETIYFEWILCWILKHILWNFHPCSFLNS